MEDKKYLKKSEIASFSTAGFGRNMIYTLMSTYALVFFTEVLGLSGTEAGTLILVARIFDALNDPLMGAIVDKTNTKWGKMRPYLAFAPIPIIIMTCLLFYAPDLSHMGKLVYAYVTYILWGMAFTVSDVPFWSLSAVMTPNDKERTSFLSFARIICTVGGILPTVLVPILVGDNVLGQKNGYLVAGLMFGILGGLLSFLAFFGTKERVKSAKKSVSLKEIFKGIAKNKLLLLILLSSLLGSCRLLVQSAGPYVANYIFYDAGLFKLENGWLLNSLLTMTVAIGVGMFVAMGILPILQKRFSFKQIYIVSTLFGAVIQLIAYFVGYGNLLLSSFMLILAGLPLGIYNVITYTMIADSADYVEWKTGERTEGVSFAFQTLMSKATAGIATFIAGLVFDAAAVVKPLTDEAGKQIFQPQSAETMNIIYMLITIIPAVSCVLAVIPMFFYDFTGKKREKILEELRERRANPNGGFESSDQTHCEAAEITADRAAFLELPTENAPNESEKFEILSEDTEEKE